MLMLQVDWSILFDLVDGKAEAWSLLIARAVEVLSLRSDQT